MNFEYETELEVIKIHPHIYNFIVEHWGTVVLKEYFENMLQDTRNGSRRGFTLAVSSAILSLSLANINVLEKNGITFDTTQDEGFSNTKWDLPPNF